ncbi:MAG: citramalate synthase [Alphaproteobacteria bacterium]|nr:citramalate synthase [Alphaproteobacteria bacterium]
MAHQPTTERVYIYDSTLRDGAQTHGVDFTSTDKEDIASQLDKLGIDYIEGGWPGANPTDDAFFAKPPRCKHAKIAAFGMTRRPSTSTANDPGLNALINSGATTITLVGKCWDFHIASALNTTLDVNLAMIRESIAHVVAAKCESLFDAEHFFDGYKSNPDVALACIKAAYESGARWIVLCDTNGGTLPDEIFTIVSAITCVIPGSHLGIHCHNDTENAVANSLAAVRAGARQVQGTINGLGERCGNANLVSIIPNLMLKMGYDVGISNEGLKHLTRLSRFLDERLNRNPDPFKAYVGSAAFAHKGGLHVSAVIKNPKSYEHIDPTLVGNQRHILVSDQSGKSNILARLQEIGIAIPKDEDSIMRLVSDVKDRESKGYAYDSADASFALLAMRWLSVVPLYFRLDSFRVIDERRWNAREELVTVSEATVKLHIGDQQLMSVAEGNGPVNALDLALRKVLAHIYPALKEFKLVDYKVRIVSSEQGTEAITRVLIESADTIGNRWSTVGVSTNIIDASYHALHDSITYHLLESGVTI